MIDEPFTVTVNSTLAPLGAERFYNLIEDRFYDASPVFRVVDNFVDQFGLSGIPAVNEKWGNETIKDDPVLTTNNDRGFSPFGYVTSGWSTVEKIVNPTPNDRNGIDQDNIATLGSEWVRSNYSNTTFIESASFEECD